jgi:hypothetical protein
MRWRHQHIDLRPEEIERLLPLVNRSKHKIGRLWRNDPQAGAFFDSLRETVLGIATAHGFDTAKCQTGWKWDGGTVSVWVQWQEEDAAP